VLHEWGEGPNGGDAIATTYGAQVLSQNNVFAPSEGTQKMGVRTTVTGYIPVAGYIRSEGDLLLNGANVFSNKPENVFDAATLYSYNLETASQSLMGKVMQGAGAQVVAAPTGI
jgi:pectate lyase